MGRVLDTWVHNPENQYKLHVAITVFWILTIIPTILWWRNSVLWVAFLSIYANAISQWTCARALKAEIEARKKSHG